MFKLFGNTEKSLEERVNQAIDLSSKVKSVFTGVVEDLNSHNEELKVLETSAREEASRHIYIAESANKAIKDNSKVIDKINQFLS